MLSIIIPVGPFADDKKYLGECLESIKAQTVKPNHVQFVFDATEIDYTWVRRTLGTAKFDAYTTPWRVGCADAWNFGVAYSTQPLNLLMGADDWLEPGCVEALLAAYDKARDDLGYYHLDVRYSTGEIQDQPCNAAMVTRKLWNLHGGFEPAAGLGAPDALLISCILGNNGRAGNLHRVAGGPLYNVRVHDGQDTRRTGKYHQPIIDVRNIATATWKPAEWVRGG